MSRARLILPVVAAILAGTAISGAPESPALAGSVRSDAEGAMEGVVVIAQREGSTILTAVTTDARGQFTFPRTHVTTGRYALRIRAAGYVLPGDAVPVEVGARTATQALTLKTATADQLAHQLTHQDWIRSMPGTDAQKDRLVRRVVNCGFCHDMERVMRTRYTGTQFLSVIARMATYAADNTSACGTRA